MATEGGGKEMNEIKTQFTTREGLYKLLPHSEYSRPNRVPFNSQGSNPVRVSFVNLNDQSGNGDRLCFNVGRELYFYIYKGVRKAADLSKPIDKRIYKGTQPTCHDFNHLTATAESVSLLVGFSAGQVQLIDPVKKETSKLFNEEQGTIGKALPGPGTPSPLGVEAAERAPPGGQGQPSPHSPLESTCVQLFPSRLRPQGEDR
ncbi:WD repeat-containing protein 20 isoform X6 [Loxodonta africana]|uniref:WD repeat-containing protein 20 isoform X6 n=1 Tax=Loxodonta africana TaxID=9785 RepID=UPI0005405ABD|nr:WD repeat-containing protein 20 isoform X5 [Loxodonta africana]